MSICRKSGSSEQLKSSLPANNLELCEERNKLFRKDAERQKKEDTPPCQTLQLESRVSHLNLENSAITTDSKLKENLDGNSNRKGQYFLEKSVSFASDRKDKPIQNFLPLENHYETSIPLFDHGEKGSRLTNLETSTELVFDPESKGNLPLHLFETSNDRVFDYGETAGHHEGASYDKPFLPPKERLKEIHPGLISKFGYQTRLAQQRMSLLGKPLNSKSHRVKDIRYRRLQMKVYNFLERPRGCNAASYHVLVLVMVLLCLGLSVFSTIPEYADQATEVLYYLEALFVAWLALEYGCRLWSAGCRSRYQGCAGRIRFATSPFCIIDIIVIVASIAVLCMGSTGQVFAASAIRGLRFFQILRMVRIDRRGGTWKLLGSVVWAHRQELMTTLYIGFLGLIFASFLIYLCEKNVNDQYATFADALWWGVVTLSTVGYGDKYPETWPGKIVASFCALLGISFFALPAGILGSGFALKVQQHQRQKHLIRRRVPAAQLIQSLWRLYASDESSMSVATWKIYLKPLPEPPQQNTFKLSNERNRENLINRIRSSSKHSSRMQPANESLLVKPHESVRKKVLVTTMSEGTSPHVYRGLEAFAISQNHHKKSLVDSELGSEYGVNRIPSEDYSLMVAPFANWASSMKTKHTKRRRSSILPPIMCAEGENSSEEASDVDEEIDPQPRTMDQLTSAHRNAIRAIRRIKLLVARRKFKEALRPYDVKDVIEQYSAGHVDLLTRVKSIQHRLDIVVGKQPMYTTKEFRCDVKHSMVNRLHKVERQINDIEGKLDILIEMAIEDRQQLLQQQKQSLTDENDTESSFEITSNMSQATLVNSPILSPQNCPNIKKSPSIPANLRSETSNKKLSLATELLRKRKESLSTMALSRICSKEEEAEFGEVTSSESKLIGRKVT